MKQAGQLPDFFTTCPGLAPCLCGCRRTKPFLHNKQTEHHKMLSLFVTPSTWLPAPGAPGRARRLCSFPAQQTDSTCTTNGLNIRGQEAQDPLSVVFAAAVVRLCLFDARGLSDAAGSQSLRSLA